MTPRAPAFIAKGAPLRAVKVHCPRDRLQQLPCKWPACSCAIDLVYSERYKLGGLKR